MSFLKIFFVYTVLAIGLFAGDDSKRIEMEIAKVYMDAYPSISVVSVSLMPTMPVEEPFVKFERIDNSTINTLKERGQFYAVYSSANGQTKKLIYRYSIDALVEGSKTKTQIAKDQLILPENVEPVFLRLGSFYDAPLSLSQAVNKYAKRFIPKASLLTARDVGVLAEVRKGQSVNAVYSVGGLEADTGAIALEDGQIGQVISVKIKSGKVLRARVAGRDLVNIE